MLMAMSVCQKSKLLVICINLICLNLLTISHFISQFYSFFFGKMSQNNLSNHKI